MCGIVGYIGTKQAYPVLIKGLHRLEYRGYDSAGVAMVHNDSLNVYKAKGKVSELEHVASDKDIEGSIGIAHTRWATHGQPNATNAHPHVSMSGDLALVHNGIIENYIELKQQLIEKGYEFKSETDTEVLVQLIDYSYRQTDSLLDAVCAALNKVIGAYAIAVIDKNHPDTLIAARKSSPLVVGVGENNSEFFVGSDASPIVEYTDKVIYLDDEQIACIRPGEDIKIIDLNNHSVDFDIKKVDLDISQLTKGGFPHFMLKEIYDQPECIRNCIRGRLFVDQEHPENNKINLSALNNFKSQLIRARHVIIVACGTSWHAGLIGKQLIEKMCRIRVEVEYASEFRYREPVIDKDDVIIAISQSGETADTLAAIQLAKENGALVFGIVNGVGSSIARESDTGVYIHVGPEIGVASTKAFTGQVVVLSMLSIALGHALGTVTDKEYSEYIAELATIPEKIQKVLEQNDKIDKLSNRYTYAKNFLYLGRGFNYPVALEGALKLKEISYIHAEGYPAAEMKHGPIALVDEDMPIVFIATHHQLYQKIISNMKEVKARNGRILAVVTEGDMDVREIADEVIEIPQTIGPFAPLLSVIPLQLLSYHVAVKKGLNVDMPRNLAKSVTVE
ncbi:MULTISPECIES: glutamine--fructose-6-phosphate transaminase (isomerizing) [Segatella]|uniref:Glutamine--fructose-6-phosphate aminotransferase [isomerizing] n=2 Tax=Segatella TaxID=2974251 RepID=D8E0E2_9BACT|nr:MULTISPECIES: glutamine--fructose-6-phosphate transaminase (isomerizing) [Segatella]EFI70878.1 glutamine-fructose-6-phosphate transaminase (isomerizing) [Segatella baroniae B14]UKK79732.1 glutamine--fructose-6-phosphate transaminase (isomerizing) [Segatella baroniae B14]GJG28754.1 glutamine--fructose-6-phosphate aminotransferase [isomerizing] [Segatella bryantii]SEQ98099.1 glucosamine--fructose-6-phosphate aminotransferase (isomerizing) [Segatella baroniae B14]